MRDFLPDPPELEWLLKRGGSLRHGPTGNSWIMLQNGHPQYVLTPKPAGGKFTCEVMQCINANRVDSGGICTSPKEALGNGLEDLRKVLGW